MTSPDIIEVRIAHPPFGDGGADVILRSSDNVDFYVLKSFMEYSSSVFKDMFRAAQGEPGKNEEKKDGLRVIFTSDTAETWKILLRFLYPSHAAGSPTLDSLDECPRVMESLRNYGMKRAEKLIIADLVAPRFVETEPLRVFALACHYGLDEEARIAARQTLHKPIIGHAHFTEMKIMTAEHYYRLQEYHILCGQVASGVARNTKWVEKKSFVWFSKHNDSESDGSADSDNGDDGDDAGVARWWERYMLSAEKALELRPCGATVLRTDLMDNALKDAKRARCSFRVFTEMRKFGEMFAEKVDKATAKASHILFDTYLHVLTSYEGYAQHRFGSGLIMYMIAL
jgi:hypothetical protein